MDGPDRLFDRVISSLVAYAKTRATLAMAARRGRISDSDRVAAAPSFPSDWHALSTVSVTQDLIELAADLADTHHLRGFAGLSRPHRRRTPDPVYFMVWDKSLLDAAEKMDLVASGAAM